MGLEEAAVPGRLSQSEAREQPVQPLMRDGRALAQRLVRGLERAAQPAFPNTRANTVSTCLK